MSSKLANDDSLLLTINISIAATTASAAVTALASTLSRQASVSFWVRV